MEVMHNNVRIRTDLEDTMEMNKRYLNLWETRHVRPVLLGFWALCFNRTKSASQKGSSTLGTSSAVRGSRMEVRLAECRRVWDMAGWEGWYVRIEKTGKCCGETCNRNREAGKWEAWNFPLWQGSSVVVERGSEGWDILNSKRLCSLVL